MSPQANRPDQPAADPAHSSPSRDSAAGSPHIVIRKVEHDNVAHDAQRAALKAEEAGERAASLADEAAKLMEEAEDEELGKVRRCPDCRERMTKHDNPDNPFTHGAWHCDKCGVCWRGMHPR